MPDNDTKKKLNNIREWKNEMFPNLTYIDRNKNIKSNPIEMAVLLANRAVESLKQ